MAAEETGTADSLDTDDALEGLSDERRIYRLLVGALGQQTADAFVLTREIQERWARRTHPDDGLRERKKRRTRQQISDVATTLFVVRGFDHVTVAEIAEIVGVSEKTIYNYFPTKESLLLDRADAGIARVTNALRTREPGESPTKAMLRALREDMAELEDLPDELHAFLPVFAEMVTKTPALRAAWLELQDHLVRVVNEELAALADVDPRDPEPMIAARAIVGLQELDFTSRIRHLEDGLRGRELNDAVLADLERAVRLLDAGLWSFNLLAQGARTRQQLSDAATAAEDARKQVVAALKQARTTWREIHKHGHMDIKQAAKDLAANERRKRRAEGRAR